MYKEVAALNVVHYKQSELHHLHVMYSKTTIFKKNIS